METERENDQPANVLKIPSVGMPALANEQDQIDAVIQRLLTPFVAALAEAHEGIGRLKAERDAAASRIKYLEAQLSQQFDTPHSGSRSPLLHPGPDPDFGAMVMDRRAEPTREEPREDVMERLAELQELSHLYETRQALVDSEKTPRRRRWWRFWSGN